MYALVLLHDLLLVRFHLVARAHAQRLVIFERDEIEDQGLERRMFGAQQRLGAAGAFLPVQPDHRRTRLRGGGLRHAQARGLRQPHRGGDPGAELGEFAAVHAAHGDVIRGESEIFVGAQKRGRKHSSPSKKKRGVWTFP